MWRLIFSSFCYCCCCFSLFRSISMRVCGLTGNIASGKSTVVAKLLEEGVSVLDCDEIAREAVEKVKEEIMALDDRSLSLSLSDLDLNLLHLLYLLLPTTTVGHLGPPPRRLGLPQRRHPCARRLHRQREARRPRLRRRFGHSPPQTERRDAPADHFESGKVAPLSLALLQAGRRRRHALTV